MEWLYALYILISLTTVTAFFVLALYVWQRRFVPGAGPFCFLMLAMAGWSLANLLQFISTGLAAKIFWSNCQYFGVVFVPVIWLAFVLQFTGLGHWVTRRNLIPAMMIPIITLGLIWTNRWHGLFRPAALLDNRGPVAVMVATFGPWFWIHTVYSYLLLLAGTVLLGRVIFLRHGFNKRQAISLLVASIVPWSANAFYIFGLTPLPELDLTPVAFAITGLVIFWSLFGLGLLNIVPLAHRTVVNNINDYVLVLDPRQCVVFLNRAARQWLGYSSDRQVTGRPVSQVLHAYPELVDLLQSTPEQGRDITLGQGQNRQHYILDVSPLHEQAGHLTGRLVVMHNITGRKQIEAEREERLAYERDQRELAEVIGEIGALLNTTLDVDAILDRLLDQLGRIVPYDSANVMLVKNGKAVTARMRGYEKFGNQTVRYVKQVSFDVSTTKSFRQMMETGQPMVVPDTASDPAWVPVEGIDHIRSWAGAPILAQGQVIAFFSLDKTEAGFYNNEYLQRLALFAGQAGLAIENARLFQAESRRRYEAETLHEAAASLSADLSLNGVLNRILIYLGRVLPFDSACVFLHEKNVLRAVAGQGLPHPEKVIGQSYPVADDALFEEMVRTRRPVYLPDAQADPRFLRWGGTSYVRGWMGIPLINRGKVIGHLTLDSKQVNAYGPTEADLAQAFAQQAAIAVENARLFQEARQARQLSDSLREIGASLVATLELDEVLARVVAGLGKVVPYDSASVMLADGDRLRLRASWGLPDGEQFESIEIGPGTVGYQAFETRQAVIVPDTRQEPRWIDIEGTTYIRCWMGVPLLVRDKAIGILTLDHSQPGFYTKEHIAIAGSFAQHAALAIENARLFEAARQHVAELNAVREASLSLTSSLDLQTVLEMILENTLHLIKTAHNANIFLYQDGHLIFGAALWRDGRRGHPFAEPRSNGLTYTVARQGQPIVVSDMRTHPLFAGAPPSWRGSIIGLPLKIGARVVGVMNIASLQPRIWPETELHILHLLADQAAVAIENARLYEQIQEQTAELETYVAERTFELQVLYELSQALGHATHLGDVVRFILLHLYQAIPHDVSASLLMTGSTGTLVIQTQHFISPALETHLREIMCSSLSSLRNQKLNSDLLEISYIRPRQNAGIRPPLESLGSLMQVPIIVDEIPVGLLLVAAEQPEKFGHEEGRLLRTAADQATESIRRLQSLLAAEHRRLDSLIAHLPNGVIVLDTSHRIVLANPAGQKFLAIASETPEPGHKLSALGEQSIETILNPDAVGHPFEIAFTLPRNYLFEVTAKPMVIDPEKEGWLLVVRDITEERATQKRIQQQERMATVGQLAAGIAHDFNNILTSIIGYAELLQVEPDMPSTAYDDLARIIGQGRRAAHLIRQILDFSRQSIAEKRPLNLATFVKETVKLLERTIPENIYITLELDPDAGSFYVNADPTQMQQVLTNLAVNARDAMPTGGALQFRLTRKKPSPGEPALPADQTEKDWVVLSITDTGTGIPPKDQPHIFEPFFTTKEVGKGTGMGLAQVYGIISQHEGHINVESQVGTGTTFTIYLPARPPALDSVLPTPLAKMPRGRGENILVVEDDLTVLKILNTLLKHLGYHPLTAANGKHALTIYEQHGDDIDLVITDVMMPDMGGAELSQILHTKNPDIRIIAITGYPLNAAAKEFLGQSIVAWLQKPLNIEQLAYEINRALSSEVQPE